MENFGARHGGTTLSVAGAALRGTAQDGSSFAARLPFDRAWDGAATVEEFATGCSPPADWGVLLVRKGGFAIARLGAGQFVAHKVGQRHVQGRTKAGGQSQQRFARRRDNQARQAYEAAAGHAARLLTGVPLLVVGGDHSAIEAVLAEDQLRGLSERVVGPFLAVPEPRRKELDAAVIDAGSVRMSVTNA